MHDDDGHFFGDNGEWGERFDGMDRDELFRYIDEHLHESTFLFWEGKPEYATLYLMELQKARERENYYIPHFSEDFYIDTLIHLIKSENRYEDLGIVEIGHDGQDFQWIHVN